uniref:Integrase, catalytic region, zinc finger, CCHC-type, peptidase aspartic, catalytic n=1 Tax=Tanacetum cinerariifolium TaxID=118510 RepID=A0A6L2J748_TANCI|nr:integrase, catalytic region, zinc finger, CCHC-type, peptidase aspartic, catalytic [Tanacetum cinerariifolium]
MPNPEDISNPTTAMNMTLILMAKAFKLNYSTSTNNNQRISSNPHNKQIAQLGVNMGQDRHMQLVGGNNGNQFRQYAKQNARNQSGYNARKIAGNLNRYNAIQNVENQNENQNENGNVVAARAEGDIDEIEDVNANCILMENLQQASTSDTQTDKLPSMIQTDKLRLSKFVYGASTRVAFRRNTSFVRNLEGADLLKGNRTINLYTINLHEMASTPPICLMARATSTKSWLWHQRLSHLNFDTISDLAKKDLATGRSNFKYHKEHLCSSCELEKSKKAPHPPKPVPNSKQRLHLLHMDLCGPMRVKSINERRYVLVIVDDYSRSTKLDISFPHVFEALCYSKNDREDIGKLGVKGDIGFFIGYSNNSYVYRVYNRMTRKIMEKMNVTFDELLEMAFEQRSSKPGLQSMTFGQINSGLDFTYAPSTITPQKPTKHELDLLFEAMYDDYIGGQPSATPRTALAAPAPQLTKSLLRNLNLRNHSF